MGYMRRIGLGGPPMRPGTPIRRQFERAPAASAAQTRPADLDPRPNVTVRDYRSPATSTGTGTWGSRLHIPKIPVVVPVVPPAPPAPVVVKETTTPKPPTPPTSSGGGGGGASAGPSSGGSRAPLPASQGPSDLPDGSGGGLPFSMNTILIAGGVALAAYILLRKS